MKRIAKASVCSVAVIIGIVLALYRDEITISREALEIIGDAESCRRAPYYCPANVLTIGIGSTGNIEQKIYSDEEIAARWVSDIKNAELCVTRFADGFHLPRSVFDATTSIVFNVGCTKMKSSTLFKFLNSGNYKAACDELPKWNKAGGKVLPGLVSRREKERTLCVKDLLHDER